MKTEIIDANTAVGKASYKLSEMSFIYPITPSSPMAEICDEMANKKEKNIFGNVLSITEMQSEAGAIGALHGSLLSGSVSTTFTSSQGLLLMLPNMYKIAGEMLPAVINIASRSLATHSLNIFCDHSDVMSARQTGFCLIASSNPQESYDFAVASFLTSIKTRIPFLHFFDGFRTSHQITNVNIFDDKELKNVYPFDSLKEFKSRAISPNNPKQYGTNESQDIFFQGREKSNYAYKLLPNELEKTFADLKKIGAKEHHIMEYYGKEDAELVLIAMASACDTAKIYIDSNNEKIGLIKINLFRPFDAKYFLNLLPKTTKKIAVLDRTKEQGSFGEPLYLDIASTILEAKLDVEVVGGRYGLGGKEFSPAMVKAVFDNLKNKNPKNHFCVGIEDDISFASLQYDKNFEIATDSKEILILGIGSDGSVGSTKNITKILGENNFVCGYSMFDSKKSGGLTRSYISVSKKQVNKPYLSKKLDLIMVNNITYLKKYDILKDLKKNGTLIVNSDIKSTEDFDRFVNTNNKKNLAQKNATIYSIDANNIALKNNLSGKISTIMQTAFFKISNIIDFKTAKNITAQNIKKTFAKKGEKTIDNNLSSILEVENSIHKIKIDEDWKNLEYEKTILTNNKYIDEYVNPVLNLNGDELPVSKVNLYGENQTSTSKYEKRSVGEMLPNWLSEKCIQCGKCSFVCPHAAIRAKLLTEKQLENAPKTLQTKEAIYVKNLKYCLEVSPKDCMSCGLCESVCPTKAIKLERQKEVFEKLNKNYEWTKNFESIVPNIPETFSKMQFKKPYFEFSGACAGCGETPYIRLLTQLFGKQLVIANATGCSSIYGGSAPTCPYTKDMFGFGTAWANSLFEDNAEFGLGMRKSFDNNRNNFKNYIETNYQNFNNNLQTILRQFLDNFENTQICQNIYLELKNNKDKYIDNKSQQNKKYSQLADYLFENLDLITPKSVWLVGGDGWAYDIDFGGLDHIFASKENVNILVLDTELYSNTGGQKSKASPLMSVEKFCASGKTTSKKDLTLSALQYRDVYVAKICLGADMNQTIKAFVEAEKYDGVSLIVAYAPCINHGIDMSKNIERQVEAVKCGYWNLFRYNPSLLKDSKNPMSVDCTLPSGDLKNFLLKERRFANYFEHCSDDLLFERAKKENLQNYQTLLKLKDFFEPKNNN